MQSSVQTVRSAGAALREEPVGLRAGAPLSRIRGPFEALALVSDELAAAEVRLSELVGSDVSTVPEVARYLLDAGGKRLRPALTALGARAAGASGDLVDLLCVGELIHLGSLLHDDVVDDGDFRRGRPSAHRIHGNAATVLTGDFCLARAVLLAAQSGGHAAVTALADAVTRMAEGEVLQLRHAGDLGFPREKYLDVIDRKSAALIAWCASAGGHLTGDPVAVEALARYGRGVGKAFQITDDVLDYAVGTGKAPGADLRERKVTLPLLLAMERVPGLRDELERGAPTAERVSVLIDRVAASGAPAAALDIARGYVDEALLALEALPPTRARDALAALGRYLVERTR